MTRFDPYLKAVTAALIAGLTAVITSLGTDNVLTTRDWLSAIVAFLAALGVVYAVPNTPKAPPDPPKP